MLDIVISGGLAVLPSGPEPADIGVAGEHIAAIGAPGSLAAIGAGRVVDAAGQIVIPGGIDPHVHCSWPMPMPGVAQHQLTEPAGAGQPGGACIGGTTTIIDFALVEDGDDGAAGDRAAAAGNGPATATATTPFTRCCWASSRPSISAQLAEAVAGRAPERQDVHDRHHPEPQGPHGRFRRHLGGAEGAGQGRRHRGDPRRGQRHRHAHVREADPRGPHRL